MVVQQDGGTGRHVLIDGYRRVAALKRLGHDCVEAILLPMDEVAALCLKHRLEDGPPQSAMEQAWLLSELIERHGVSQVKLAQLLGHSNSWVSRRLALVNVLPELAQDLVRKGRLCPHGAMRHLVPLARAKPSDCKKLVEQLATTQTPVSARELGRLHVAWRSATREERQRIVQQPLLYLRAEKAAATEPCVPPGPERLLRDDFDSLISVFSRISRRLRRDKALAAPLPLVFDNVWRTTQLAIEELEHLMEGRIHVGPRHTKSDLRSAQKGPRHQSD
jgi:hypothetical protein